MLHERTASIHAARMSARRGSDRPRDSDLLDVSGEHPRLHPTGPALWLDVPWAPGHLAARARQLDPLVVDFSSYVRSVIHTRSYHASLALVCPIVCRRLR